MDSKTKKRTSMNETTTTILLEVVEDTRMELAGVKDPKYSSFEP
jgi:hypothetical protein